MSPDLRREICAEADLMERFSRSYRHTFATLIQRMNQGARAEDQARCLRACMESLDMLLESHTRLAEAMRHMAEEPSPPLRSAAA